MNQTDNDLGCGRNTIFIIYEYNPETGILRPDYEEKIEQIKVFLRSLGFIEMEESQRCSLRDNRDGKRLEKYDNDNYKREHQ